jgi:hypothetical protein
MSLAVIRNHITVTMRHQRLATTVHGRTVDWLERPGSPMPGSGRTSSRTPQSFHLGATSATQSNFDGGSPQHLPFTSTVYQTTCFSIAFPIEETAISI